MYMQQIPIIVTLQSNANTTKVPGPEFSSTK
jgi:hypothetical protein